MAYEPILKNSRWCLLKRRENLTDNQTVKLKELLQYNIRQRQGVFDARGLSAVLGIR